MPYSTRYGAPIYYETVGEGPAMVFIHANPFDHHLWMYQAAHFSTWFRCINIDIRGYGRSAKIEAPFTLDDMCQDIWGVCEDEGLNADDPRSILFGISVGSKMAALLAHRHPRAFSALVLVGGTSSAQPSPHFDSQINGYEKDVAAYHAGHLSRLVSPTFADSKLGRYLLNTYIERNETLNGKAIAQGFRALSECDMLPHLPGLKMPVLVINGEYDTALPRGKITAERVANGRHVVIPGAGHGCCLDDPASFDEAVLSFLKSNGLMPAKPTIQQPKV